jgi:hypothetical protein
VVVDRVGYKIYTRNVCGAWLRRKLVLNQAAVIGIFKYLEPMPSTIY